MTLLVLKMNQIGMDLAVPALSQSDLFIVFANAIQTDFDPGCQR